MIEILGYIFATILAVIAAFIIYHIIKGLVVGIDLMRWRLEGITREKIRSTPNWKPALFVMFLECWGECVGYNGSITYSRNGRTWEGYGTGRYNG